VDVAVAGWGAPEFIIQAGPIPFLQKEGRDEIERAGLTVAEWNPSYRRIVRALDADLLSDPTLPEKLIEDARSALEALALGGFFTGTVEQLRQGGVAGNATSHADLVERSLDGDSEVQFDL